MPLRVSPCRTLCAWGPTRALHEGQRLFACAGCGSQWVRTEAWTPRQADGAVPPGVREELTSSGTGPAGPLTSAPGAAAAGSAGS